MNRILFFLLFCLSSSSVFAEPYPWDLLRNDTAFKKEYLKLLGPKASERWLVKLQGPSTPAEKMTINGVDYLYLHSCKPHWCDTDNLILLYSKTNKTLYGKLFEEGTVTWLGEPDQSLSSRIEDLYVKRFKP
jgi:hypothetical protein